MNQEDIECKFTGSYQASLSKEESEIITVSVKI
jgi:hypothetical protein